MSNPHDLRTTPLVLVVDDHPLMRDAIAGSLTREERFEVITASSGPEALVMHEKHAPNLVLVDVSLTTEMSGIELTNRLLNADPDALVVMLTSHTDDETVAAALDAGANGFLTKCAASEADLATVLTSALDGEAVYDKVSSGVVTRLMRTRHQRPAQILLTAREEDILRLLCSEVVETKEIAAALFISDHTVKTHLESLYKKLGVSSKVAACVRALRTGLISEQSLAHSA